MTKRKIVSSRENTSTHEFNDSPSVDQNESSESIEPEPTLSAGSEVPHVQLDVQERKSNKYWIVDLEDANGMIKEGHLRLKDVWMLSHRTKIIVHWNEHGQPIGESGGLLGLFLGVVAGNFKNFPISYEKWPLVPTESYRNGAYRDIIQNLTREQNIALLPKGVGVSLEQWATFIDYRLKSRTQETANKRVFTRVEMYPISHKKKDGSFVNDEASEKTEQLTLIQANESSTDDAYIKLFGKEHPGRVRGVGSGVCPSQVIKSSNSLGGFLRRLKTATKFILEVPVNLLAAFKTAVNNQRGGYSSGSSKPPPLLCRRLTWPRFAHCRELILAAVITATTPKITAAASLFCCSV
ncbi:uncharacterized protein LOC107647085 [Arachis ipaensis]|uniref:uncharacterized protein LOC107647085 n=1 Tax=Arachis ipaensis TaxID=130454 RepID=UPI0007AFCC4D|nr:uncharacterized protein LOC107647085 [Arachis ipaensis]